MPFHNLRRLSPNRQELRLTRIRQKIRGDASWPHMCLEFKTSSLERRKDAIRTDTLHIRASIACFALVAVFDVETSRIEVNR